jgi:biopolymer transport protein ExbD
MIEALLPSRPRRGVNLTPLIDVVFILLMFFMLTSTFSQWRSIELLTPVASQSATAQNPQTVLLGEDGSLSFGEVEIFVAHYNELGRTNLNALSNDEPVLIIPAADATVQDMISTLENLQALGFSKATLGRTASPSTP